MDQILLFAFGFVVFAISSAATVAAILMERHEEIRSHERIPAEDRNPDRHRPGWDQERADAGLRVVRGVGS